MLIYFLILLIHVILKHFVNSTFFLLSVIVCLGILTHYNRGIIMNTKTLSGKEVIVIGLMLFALFLGAGNMIFPPALGQAAGTNIWIATAGFLITGVGLPLLGVTAIALSGMDLQSLASRIHPIFGIVFTITMYLAIGPFFGIPRTGTVAFEIGITPFLSDTLNQSGIALFIFTVVFFGVTYSLALNPSKLIDRIGKLLTPILLAIISILVIKSMITPMGSFQAPNEAYKQSPFFKGFIEGYLTMDTIAALVFGIVVISAIKEKGVTNKKILAITTIKAGAIAAAGLMLVYVSLAYLGASSVEQIGFSTNGGEILASSSSYLFGSLGTLILGLAITFATLTTSVGLVSSCGTYFSKIIPKLSYKTVIAIMSIFSMIIANVGLTQLLSITLPILVMIYPLAIVLIVLSFMHSLFSGRAEVYSGGLIGASFISILDGLNYAGFNVSMFTNYLSDGLPLFNQGVGWVVPAIVGAFVGFVISKSRRDTTLATKEVRKVS